jgi:hypothetical protein
MTNDLTRIIKLSGLPVPETKPTTLCEGSKTFQDYLAEVSQVNEVNWKGLATAGVMGAAALSAGSHAAKAQNYPGYSTAYLQQAASGQGRSMISADDARRELDYRSTHADIPQPRPVQQDVSDRPLARYSTDYLKRAISGGRSMISAQDAQDELNYRRSNGIDG